MKAIEKKIFKHGGSFALDLPREFIDKLSDKNVVIEDSPLGILIRQKSELDTIEDDPMFTAFVAAIVRDALENPEKLHDVQEVWDSEWDDLLDGVQIDEE